MNKNSFYRFAPDFSDIYKFIYTVYFLWTATTICDTLLLLQIESVEFFSNPCFIITISQIVLLEFVSSWLSRWAKITTSWCWSNCRVWHSGHSCRFSCFVILVRDFLVDLMKSTSTSIVIGIYFRTKSNVYYQPLLWVLKSQFFLKDLEMFHVHEKLSKE